MAPFDAGQAKLHQEAWARHLRVPLEYANALGMKFRLVPPGEFEMGSTDEQIQTLLKPGLSPKQAQVLPGETPLHRVRILRPMYVGAHEVTVKAFRAFARATGYKTEAETAGGVWLASEGAWVKDAAALGRIPAGNRPTTSRRSALSASMS